MDPEQGLGVQAGQATQTAVNQAPKTASINDGFSEFGEHSTFNTALALTWMVAIFSIIATLFFWWMNKNEADALADKKSEKDALVQQISSPGSVETERKAQDFKSSVKQLQKAYADKYSYTQFLTGLNSKLTKDIQLDNIAITSDGALNIGGSTKGYRAVADLMMALKSWDTLENVDLVSAANTTTDSKAETVFVIKANINKEKQKAAEASKNASSDSGNTTNTEGGNSATIQ